MNKNGLECIRMVVRRDADDVDGVSAGMVVVYSNLVL